MCIRRGKQPCDWDDSNFKSKQKAGRLTAGFDGAGCLKWFSGDGSSVWCQWDRGGARRETGVGPMATAQDSRMGGWIDGGREEEEEEEKGVLRMERRG